MYMIWSTKKNPFRDCSLWHRGCYAIGWAIEGCPGKGILDNPHIYIYTQPWIHLYICIWIYISNKVFPSFYECDIASPLYNWNAAVNFPGQGQQKKQEEEVQRLLLSSSSCDWPDGYHRLLLVLILIVIPKWWNYNPFGLLSHYGLLYP